MFGLEMLLCSHLPSQQSQEKLQNQTRYAQHHFECQSNLHKDNGDHFKVVGLTNLAKTTLNMSRIERSERSFVKGPSQSLIFIFSLIFVDTLATFCNFRSFRNFCKFRSFIEGPPGP